MSEEKTKSNKRLRDFISEEFAYEKGSPGDEKVLCNVCYE